MSKGVVGSFFLYLTLLMRTAAKTVNSFFLTTNRFGFREYDVTKTSSFMSHFALFNKLLGLIQQTVNHRTLFKKETV